MEMAKTLLNTFLTCTALISLASKMPLGWPGLAATGGIERLAKRPLRAGLSPQGAAGGWPDPCPGWSKTSGLAQGVADEELVRSFPGWPEELAGCGVD